MKVVATLSTIPSRIDLIRPTIESLLNQACPVEKVEVNVPYWCVRTAEPYKVPDWLTSMDRVEVHRVEDYGAITKVASTLIRHKDEDVYVWSVDDDFVYHPEHLATLMSYADGISIVCLHGGIWSQFGFSGGHTRNGNVDIVEGFFGIVYPPRCIREDFQCYVEKTSADWDNRKSDDIILSNYFALHRIPMRQGRYDPRKFRVVEAEQKYGNLPDALKHQDDGHAVRYVRVLNWLKSNGLCGWRDLPPINLRQPIRHFGMPMGSSKRPPPFHYLNPEVVYPRSKGRSPYGVGSYKKVNNKPSVETNE